MQRAAVLLRAAFVAQHAGVPLFTSAATVRALSSQHVDPAREAGSWQRIVCTLGGAVAGGATLLTSSALAEQREQEPAEQVTAVLPDGSKVIIVPAVASDTPPPEGGWVKVSRPLSKLPEAPAALSGTFQLPALPFALNALEPHMSSDTLAVHWGKHHRTYLENLNKQVSGDTSLDGKSLEEVVKASYNGGKPTPTFNNAAQAWNHEFFWSCLQPGGGDGAAPGGALAEAIQRDFGGVAGLKDQLVAAGTSQFGSGWVWLLSDSSGKLRVMKTSNAVTPVVAGWVPLLVVDVWEHAYYIDFQNRRADYLKVVLEHLANWAAASQRYEAVAAKKEGNEEDAVAE